MISQCIKKWPPVAEIDIEVYKKSNVNMKLRLIIILAIKKTSHYYVNNIMVLEKKKKKKWCIKRYHLYVVHYNWLELFGLIYFHSLMNLL